MNVGSIVGTLVLATVLTKTTGFGVVFAMVLVAAVLSTVVSLGLAGKRGRAGVEAEVAQAGGVTA